MTEKYFILQIDDINRADEVAACSTIHQLSELFLTGKLESLRLLFVTVCVLFNLCVRHFYFLSYFQDPQ